MKLNLTQKIIKDHLVTGDLSPGSGISIKIDRTLTQDSTGTMAYLQYEAISEETVKTECSVAYIDHNMLQSGPENMDDHIYIQTIADKSGVIFSRPGNGICHRLNLDRFSAVGKTLLGSDSHTPTCGAVAMIAIGAGGLDVAAAMAGGAYYLNMPSVIGVELTGSLRPGVGAKDVILEVLRILSVKGGVGKVIEYFGEGVKNLSVSQRATIANMGAELGATTSVFPADERTEAFFIAQGRINDFRYLAADEDCEYERIITVEMSSLEPLAAMPHSPDNVKKVSEIEGVRLNQVIIGSCTNSSYEDLVTVAKIIEGKTVHPSVSLAIAPGSKQVLKMLSDEGYLSVLIDSGARILECGCGPCIGMGQSPNSAGVSLRTFNRNFKGRSGTVDADVYLVSPEVAAVSAVTGVLTDPMGKVDFVVEEPNVYPINDNMFIYPSKDKHTPVIKGPNIKEFPKAYAPEDELICPVVTRLADNITTDDIMPSNAKLLPYRSNIEYLSNYCLTPVDENFPSKALKEENGSIILAGENYGQGSSREHAALAPLYLGVKMVLAKSFARIHKSNLINNGILPIVFTDISDYDRISEYDNLKISELKEAVMKEDIIIENVTTGEKYGAKLIANDRERVLLSHGGLINYLKTI